MEPMSESPLSPIVGTGYTNTDDTNIAVPNIPTTDKEAVASYLLALQRLIGIVAQLRSPQGGCPWDLAQTQQSLLPYVIEEAYEVVDAIRTGNQTAIAEELGDLLLQVVLQAQVATDQGYFNLSDVANHIAKKLIRRHPHVFGAVTVQNLDEVRENWEQIKAAEKQESGESAPTLSNQLQRYPRTLPPLMAAMKVSKKAAANGFEWDQVEGVWEKFHEELAEFQEALTHSDRAHQEEELGDLLFTLVNIARWHDLDPSEALRTTQHKFIQRLAQIEQAIDRPLTEFTPTELDNLWQQAKARLAKEKQP